MITRSERADGSGRVFRIALVLSLLVHLAIGFLAYESSADLRRVLARIPVRPAPQPSDEVVTLSTAIRIEKRAVARPQPHPVRAQRAPAPRVAPQPPAAVVPTASRVRAELAKAAPHGTPAPTAPPATAPPETQVAAVQRPAAATAPQPPQPPQPPQRAERPTHPARLSDAQLAAIQHDLAKTIVQARAENDPLSNVSHPVAVAAAPHRYAIDFAALAGDMREAQGLCDPIRGWHADGWDYYDATCTIQEPDGSISRKPMPWPVRWLPRDDPWSGAYRVATGPMPLPPPGWRPAGPIDPDFIPYLRKGGYPI